MNTIQNSDEGFAKVLKQWRKRRRISQLELSSLASISSRHISFLEKARANPSRDMVLKLGAAMDIPPTDVNSALTIAGYAQAYPKADLNDKSVAALEKAITSLLEKHMPWPAVACSQSWDILNMNRAAQHLMELIGFDQERNLMQAMLLSADKNETITNWPEVAKLMLRRLDAEQLHRPNDLELKKVRHLLATHPRLAGDQLDETNSLDVVVPVQIKVGDSVLSLISMIAQFGAVQEITYSGIHVELFFPTDESTEKYFDSLY